MFRYYLLKALRNKNYLFWCMIFPLVIMLCMNAAFGNIYDAENRIDPKKTVVICESDSYFATHFAELINEFAKEASEQKFFELVNADSAGKGKELLLDSSAEILFIATEDDIEVYLSEDHSITSGIIAKSVVDRYKTSFLLLNDLYENAENVPDDAFEEIGKDLEKKLTYTVQEKGIFSNSPNPYTWYFFSTLVMGMFFNAMTGVNLVSDLKADVSGEAMRLSVSPAKKGRMIFYAFIARLIPSLMITFIHLSIMKFGFKIPLGSDPLRLIIFVTVANIFSICFGVICGVIFKGTLVSRENKTTAVLMTSVFISGEMVAELPGIIEKNIPLLNDINPATVMNMALYRLAMYNNTYDFYLNMIKLIAASVIFLTYGAVILRREKYASV
ncbi:MAG: ABC transporter permease [Lachnospiraceae bacterium]|nr:ABC transporter permease [Lachnospiraceae bacterium]